MPARSDDLGPQSGRHLSLSALSELAAPLRPQILAALTFLTGAALLLSGAMPAGEGRLEQLDALLPLGVIEASHFLGSIAGAALLVLSQGLARRLDAAFYLAAIAIVTGIVTSLLKGFGYEEAAWLMVLLLVFWHARPAFDRRAAFFDTRFSTGWTIALAGALGASIWLGLFAFRHVDYSRELWWQFELHGEASRFLRASVGASVVLLLVGMARLVRPAPHEAPVPTDRDLDDAARVIAAQHSTFPFLAYLRDKALLFNDERTAFLMYAVQGRTWVALGDPVGPDDQMRGLIRQFLARCDDFGGVPVFYQVGKTRLHRYADFGLSLAKLGEKAYVDLTTFHLQGPEGAKYRQVVRRLTKDGGSFRLVDAADVPAILHELKEVSDDWLATKGAAEKGFSLGFFDEAYVRRFPVGVVEVGGRIQAFANVWQGPGGEELSIDLMRYHHDAPGNVMEALIVHLLLWGHDHGYRRFALGMAPLSGFEHSATVSLWSRLGAFLYDHADATYNFQGLRAYKDKFKPTWEPQYLAFPGGRTMPHVLADLSALVAGGYWKIFRRGGP